MSTAITKTAPKIKDLYSFGLIMGGFFLIIVGPWGLLFKGTPYRIWTLPVSLFFLTAALAKPEILSWPYRVWMKFGEMMGFINSRIILLLLFVLIFTPVGWIKRVWRGNSLNLKFDKNLSTYRETPIRGQSMKQQF